MTALPPDYPSAFRPVPRTGVIYVMTEAHKRGYRSGDPEWANLGQGAPEAGPLPGAPDRIGSIPIAVDDQEYAPVPGVYELRQAVAELYNALYRVGKSSQYTAENVCISGGGRAALTRAAAALGNINLGHFLPDYTAYEELLGVFGNFTPIPVLLDAARGYEFTPDELRKEVLGRGLSAILVSNPCNPTGKVIWGDELADWVSMAREVDCALLMDEFYSNYIWIPAGGDAPATVSAAAFVDDVNRDPVILFNGLTKNWRYPGWRIAWTVGPKAVIEAISSAASFLDGGANRPMQRAAVPLLHPDYVRREALAIQNAFKPKRQLMLDGLEGLGISIDRYPGGSFYAWGNLSRLPAGLQDGMDLFRAALEQKVIIVPGEFFDVNPGRRRPGRASRYRSYARFSFGPDLASLERGLEGLKRALRA